MKKQSAGLLLYRSPDKNPEVLLVHPGGPFWAKKDLGAWSIPKGEFVDDEDVLAAAKREFKEELGSEAPDGVAFPLGSAKQSSGKVVFAWALESDFDTQHVTSNEFEMEWPPKSGKSAMFPEVDKAEWFSLAEANIKLVTGQVPLLERLAELLDTEIGEFVKPSASPGNSKKSNGGEGQTSLF